MSDLVIQKWFDEDLDAASGPAAFVLSADAGTYNITGFGTTFLRDLLLSANPGVYVITGSDATLAADRLLSANPGAYVITGAAATLLADRLLSAGAGSYTITGLDAVLIYTPIGGTPDNANYIPTYRRRR